MNSLPENRFPDHLLETTNSQRLDYFYDYLIAHEHLGSALTNLFDAICMSEPGSLIFLFGPVGVGKSVVLKKIKQQLIENVLTLLHSDYDWLPIVSLNAPSYETGNFNWKDFYIRLLCQLLDPFLDKKLLLQPKNRKNSRTPEFKMDKNNPAAYRKAVENALKARKAVVLIDQATNFKGKVVGQNLVHQVNVLRSIATETGCTFVLAGSYELLKFRSLSSEICYWSGDLHFPRYNPQNIEQKTYFLEVLDEFQRHLPIAKVPNLTSEWEFFYERSLGSIGLLKRLFNNSLYLALQEGSSELTFEHFKKGALSGNRLKKIYEEILEAERVLFEDESSFRELRSLLRENEFQDKSDFSLPKPNSKKTALLKGKRVGVRRPGRDPVGRKHQP